MSGVGRRQALRITAVAGVGLALGGGLLAEVLRRAGLHRASTTRSQLGTLVTITVVHPEAETARALVERAFAEIERLESVLSRHREGTPLARLNRDGALAGAPAELTHVLGKALEYARLSDGAFDPTVAPVLALWSGRRGDAANPSGPELEGALARVGWQDVAVAGSDVHLGRPGAALTLDGIAKGYVVDRAVAVLTGAGAERVLVDAGGDLATGKALHDDEPWRIALQDPRGGGSMGVLELAGGSVASSGDYMQAYTRDLRHHHIIDPRTGRSPEHTAAVTVVAPTAMDADALSTAAFVLGPEGGVALLESLDGVEGLIVTKDQSRHATRGFDALAV